MKKNDGFTLIELLAVIAIMAVLAVAAITGYNSMARRSRERAYESKKQEIEDAAIKFAKETNLKNSTTISVNKLVAQGFLQPDSSSADGLAQVNNPLNHDNMICNLITITIEDDIYIAKYSEQNKDCDIAEQELADFQIGVSIFEWPETNNKLETSIPISGNTAAWTNKDIVLRVRSDVYTDFVSVSYDFDGQTITKPKNTPVDDNVYNEEDYNKLAIKDVQVMFNSEVTITYNMSDGSIHSRTIVVRVDKEVPTARAVVANDVTIGSTKKVKLYLDDANGSGVAGFYCSKDSSFPSGTPFIHDQSNKDSIEECAGSFAGYNSHFYGEQSTYYIKVVDKAGNELVTEPLAVSNFETADKSCQMKAHKTDETELNNAYEWYNTAVRVRGTTNQAIGTMGVKYFIGQLSAPPAENKLTKFFDGNTNNGVLTDYVDITSEKDLKKYYMGLQGLEKDKTIYHCLKSVGVDWHKPTVSVTCDSGDNCGTYKQKHTINITVQDDRSGFYSDANSIKVGWSTSSSTPPTQWTTITGGTISNYKNASNKTITDGKMTFTTDVNGYSSGSPLTGDYYIWVQGESIKDKAQNAADNTGGVLVRYDNTPPTCTNSGGSSSWVNTNVTIKGTCTDSHSKCKQVANTGDYTYDASGSVTRTIKTDMNSSAVSPGTVYDNAGNSTQCPADRTVKRDTVAPTISNLVYYYRNSIYKDSTGSWNCQLQPNNSCSFVWNYPNSYYELTKGTRDSCIQRIKNDLAGTCTPTFNHLTLNKTGSINSIDYLYSANNDGAQMYINSVSASDTGGSGYSGTTITYGNYQLGKENNEQTTSWSYKLDDRLRVNGAHPGYVFNLEAKDGAGNSTNWKVFAVLLGAIDVDVNASGCTGSFCNLNKHIKYPVTNSDLYSSQYTMKRDWSRGWVLRFYIRTYYINDDSSTIDWYYFWTYYSNSTHKVVYNSKDMCPGEGCQLHGWYYIYWNGAYRWFWFNTNELPPGDIPNGALLTNFPKNYGNKYYSDWEVCDNSAYYMATGNSHTCGVKNHPVCDGDGVCSWW